MKFLISLVALAALTAPATAEAHNNCGCNHARAAVSVGSPTVSVAWVWVPANRAQGIHAHWFHPAHGREFTNRVGGRPAVRPNANANWVPGHWEGRRRNRHWVSGHWSPRAQNRAQPNRRRNR